MLAGELLAGQFAAESPEVIEVVIFNTGFALALGWRALLDTLVVLNMTFTRTLDFNVDFDVQSGDTL